VRAQCDAIEIAQLLLGSAPHQLPLDEQIRRLRNAQDPTTGLVPPLGADGLPVPERQDFGSNDATYHVLSVGYALDLLGSAFPHPIYAVSGVSADQLVGELDRLPWNSKAWSAGAWIDAWATAAHWNLMLGEPGASGALEALFGWLHTRVDPWTGTWGTPSAAEGRLQVVNGYYRLTRGSFAQFGLPIPHAERLIDTVLDHARDARYFAPGRQNACNVLDVAHPLWLARAQTSHRTAEVQAWAAAQLEHALAQWQDGAGFGFVATPGGATPGTARAGAATPATACTSAERTPGLQGTEMWLSLLCLLGDLLGMANELGYRPRGVHRPEAARAGLAAVRTDTNREADHE
jgi:hypothetical protein